MQPRTGEEWYRQNCKCVNFPEGNLVWFERCWDEAIKFAKSAKNAEGSDKEDQGDEEIIKLDLKKARESGFENRCKNDMTQAEWNMLKNNIKEYIL
jgi:hypothetical protein